MLIKPPSLQSTQIPTDFKSDKGPRRRLFFLLATAAMASSLGIALGSALRFQIVPVSQTSLFKPQQDFPPLDAWPPEVPSIERTERDTFETNWDDEAPVPQLVYNDSYNEQPAYLEEDAYYEEPEEVYSDEPYISEETFIPEDVASPNSAAFIDQDGAITDADFEEASPAPDSENSTNKPYSDSFDSDSDVIEAPQLDNSTSVPETSPWFDKEPLSDSQFTDGPVLTAPDISIPSSDIPPD